jgi:hypothetical protein
VYAVNSTYFDSPFLLLLGLLRFRYSLMIVIVSATGGEAGPSLSEAVSEASDMGKEKMARGYSIERAYNAGSHDRSDYPRCIKSALLQSMASYKLTDTRYVHIHPLLTCQHA